MCFFSASYWVLHFILMSWLKLATQRPCGNVGGVHKLYFLSDSILTLLQCEAILWWTWSSAAVSYSCCLRVVPQVVPEQNEQDLNRILNTQIKDLTPHTTLLSPCKEGKTKQIWNRTAIDCDHLGTLLLHVQRHVDHITPRSFAGHLSGHSAPSP